VTKNGKKQGFYELIAERLMVDDGIQMDPMNRGSYLEEHALDIFEQQTKKKVDKRKIIWQREDDPNIACSPDGVIGDAVDTVVAHPDEKPTALGMASAGGFGCVAVGLCLYVSRCFDDGGQRSRLVGQWAELARDVVPGRPCSPGYEPVGVRGSGWPEGLVTPVAFEGGQ